MFLLLARFHDRPMSYKVLILAFTIWIFEWTGLNTHQRGEISTSGWRPWLKNVIIPGLTGLIECPLQTLSREKGRSVKEERVLVRHFSSCASANWTPGRAMISYARKNIEKKKQRFVQKPFFCWLSAWLLMRCWLEGGKEGWRSRFTENKLVLLQFTGNKIGISRFTKKEVAIFDTNLRNFWYLESYALNTFC